MTARAIATVLLLALGVAIVLLSAAGLLAARDGFDRLHVPGPATILGPIAIALALAVAEGLTSATVLRAVLVAVVMIATGPVLVHATARAERLRRCGDLDVRPENGIDPP